MTTRTIAVPLSTDEARWAVSQACLAPSLHNTQPWRFNLRLALRKLGFDADVTVLPDVGNPRLLARVTPRSAAPPNSEDRRRFAALRRRHTHRGAFDVQAELSDWTPPPTSRRADGVPVTAYAAEPAVGADELAPRDFDGGRGLGVAEVVMNAPGLVAVLVTDGDLQDDWLAGGQALERVLVCAAAHGVYAAVHSQATEVHNLRNELRRELCVPGHPQILLRFGYSDDVLHTRRRPVADVFELAQGVGRTAGRFNEEGS